MEVSKWFKPKDITGWKKSMSAKDRRRLVLRATDRRKSMRNRYIEAGRKMLALSNVTNDVETYNKARSDADYFFNKARKK